MSKLQEWNEAAARSAAESLRVHAARLPHTEAIAECPHCNARFLAQWALDALGPEPPKPMPPGPSDPPRREKPSQWTDHPRKVDAAPRPGPSAGEQKQSDEAELLVMEQLKAQWFIQGGTAEFGGVEVENARNADAFVSAVLAHVRGKALVDPPVAAPSSQLLAIAGVVNGYHNTHDHPDALAAFAALRAIADVLGEPMSVAAPPETPRDWKCGDCHTATWCEYFQACLAESTPDEALAAPRPRPEEPKQERTP